MNSKPVHTLRIAAYYSVPVDKMSWLQWDQMGVPDGLVVDCHTEELYHKSYPVIQYIGYVKALT